MSALLLGAIQFAAPKGTIPHRTVGWTWVGLMVVMLTTAFINHDILLYGPFSPKVCCRESIACSTSAMSRNTMPSPFSPSRIRLM